MALSSLTPFIQEICANNSQALWPNNLPGIFVPLAMKIC